MKTNLFILGLLSVILFSAKYSGMNKIKDTNILNVETVCEPQTELGITLQDFSEIKNETRPNACNNCPHYDKILTPTEEWQHDSWQISLDECYIYRVEVVEGRTYTFKTGCGDGAYADPDFQTNLELMDASCGSLAEDYGSCGNYHSKITWTSTYTGYAHLKISHFDGSEDDGGSYTLAYNEELGCTDCPDYNEELPTPDYSWQLSSRTIAPDACYIYKVEVENGKSYTFKTGCGDGAFVETGFYSNAELYDEDCNMLMESDNDCESNGSFIFWTSSYSGFAYLRVILYDDEGYDHPIHYAMAYRKETCISSEAWGWKDAPTACNPEVEFAENSMTNDYATLYNVKAGSQYTFTSSIGTDFLVIRNESFTGPVVAAGTTPVTITAPADGQYFMHINSDSSCGWDSQLRTTKAIYTGPVDYCPVVSNNIDYGISQVKTTSGIVNFNNITGPGQYTYYPSKIVSQVAGERVNLRLNGFASNNTNTVGWGVWVDWNNNKCFDDEGELVFSSTLLPVPLNTSILVPAGTPPGDYRMRVVANAFAAAPPSCGNLGGIDSGEAEDYTFRVISNNNYDIATSSSPVAGGSTTGAGTYPEGATVTVTATPNPGYSFKNWQEDGVIVSTNPSYSFVATGNRNLLAKFKLETGGGTSYTITTISTPAIGGTTTGAGSYISGTNATVKATANAGYVFDSWLEGTTVVATTPKFVFTVTGNRTLKAKFVKASYSIVTNSTPAIGGTTTGAGSYVSGTNATVKATASAGYVFDSWLEGTTVVATTPKFVFTVTGNRTLKAKFAKASYNIVTSSTPVAGGTTTGGGSYLYGKNVTVKATANAGYVFESWLQGTTVVATTPKFVFTVTGNRTLKAKFVKASYNIVTNSTPVAGGTTTGGGSYLYGRNVTVKATANAGYVFESWLQGTTVVATTPKYVFTVTGNRTLKAKFVKATSALTDGGADYAVTEKNPNESAQNQAQLYPNPFTDYLMVDLKTDEIIRQIELYDMSGRRIVTKTVNEVSKYQLDTRQIVKGNYLLVIQTNKGSRSMKVFKK